VSHRATSINVRDSETAKRNNATGIACAGLGRRCINGKSGICVVNGLSALVSLAWFYECVDYVVPSAAIM
jgi:hypothetical protein